jgi:ubiquinone/menaquinone biosynthesis C-methylase UbiE
MKRRMEELAKIQGGRVVDVATRYGEFALKLHGGLCGYSEIIGIDNDPDTVKEAEKRCLGSGISFRVMDARRMDFEDDSLIRFASQTRSIISQTRGRFCLK